MVPETTRAKIIVWISIFLCVVITFHSHASESDVSRLEGHQLRSLNRCGAFCLLVASRDLGHMVTIDMIDEVLSPDGKELSMLELKHAAEKLGLASIGLKWRQTPPWFSCPIIIKTVKPGGQNHFVTLLDRRNDAILVADFPHPPVWLSLPVFEQQLGWDQFGLSIANSKFGCFVAALGARRNAILYLGAFLLVCLIWCITKRRGRASTVSVVLVFASCFIYGCDSIDTAVLPVVFEPSFLELSAQDSSDQFTKPNSLGEIALSQGEFTLTNHSRKRILIDSIQSGCGCSEVSVDNATVEPNSSTTFRVLAELPETGLKSTSVMIKVESQESHYFKYNVLLRGKPNKAPVIISAPVSYDLATADKPIRIKTIEVKKSDPWIQGLSAEHGSLKTELLNESSTDSKEDADLTIRTYEFEVARSQTRIRNSDYLVPVTLDGKDKSRRIFVEIPEDGVLTASPGSLLLRPTRGSVRTIGKFSLSGTGNYTLNLEHPSDFVQLESAVSDRIVRVIIANDVLKNTQEHDDYSNAVIVKQNGSIAARIPFLVVLSSSDYESAHEHD